LLFFLGVQVTLGAFVIWSGKNPLINTAHVVNGALVLATSLVLSLRSFRAGFERAAVAVTRPARASGSAVVRVEAAPLTAAYSRTGDFVALAKPRLNMLVVASTLVGYAMADGEALGLLRLCGVLLGTGLVAGGASAFNQVLERDLDALMRRTRRRPLPDQRLQPMEGALFATALTLIGVLMIVAVSNVLA